MNPSQDRYWPFAVPPEDQRSEQDRRMICFLETAYREGYRPYMCGIRDFGAETERRQGLIFFRTPSRWEVILSEMELTGVSAYLPDFDSAASVVLLWLRGCDETNIAEIVRRQRVD